MPTTPVTIPTTKETNELIEKARKNMLKRMSALSWTINEHIKADHVTDQVVIDSMELALTLENFRKAFK